MLTERWLHHQLRRGLRADPTAASRRPQAWTVRAGLSAGFTDTLEAHLDGSHTDIDAESDERPDHLGGRRNVVWTPHPGLTMGPEVAYNHFENVSDDTADSEDQDVWGVMWRIQRDF